MDSSLDTNGYTKFPNGLILQWGFASAAGTVTFPTPFNEDCYAVVTALSQDRGTSGGVTAKTTTNFTLATYAAYWIAVGK